MSIENQRTPYGLTLSDPDLTFLPSPAINFPLALRALYSANAEAVAATIIRSTVTSNGLSGLAIFYGSTVDMQSSASLFNKGPGAIMSEGYNLIEEQVGCLMGGSNVGNIAAGQEPLRGTLALNGGKTKNHLPAATSPVVDVIPAAFCEGRAFDQRRITRPRDGNNNGSKFCDIGASER